ncbi:MAG: Hpt domain-containing protein [Pontiellaceae bacterium]|jgi:HPt (histidine-containing phosphotransfer) domain-containing protein|nr:Hpt domain-containing protein [Pontiellaceae bacterium]
MALKHAVEMVRQIVPDVDSRMSQFQTDEFELDDDLISAFCEELTRLTGDLKTGFDTSDFELTRKSAHSLKGMCGTMGLPEISVLCQEIEFTLRAGRIERCAQLGRALLDWAANWITDYR